MLQESEASMTALDTRAAPDLRQPSVGPSAEPRGSSRWPRVWPLLVPALVLSVVYGRTLQRTTGNYFSVDTTKFDYLGLVLGTAHPPGYPLYTLLNAAVVRLVGVGSVALRANLLSAVFGVLTCVLAVSVLRHLGVGRALAAGGATALGMLLPFWRYAVVAEVYTLTTAFVIGVLACVLCFEASGRPGWLRAAVLVFALSFSHATSNVLLVPGLLLYLVLRRPRWLFGPRELAGLLPAAVLLALGPYAYLPWRTAVGGSTYLDSQVRDPSSFWEVLSGARFGGRMFAAPLPEVWGQRLPELAGIALQTFGPLLLAAALGLLVLVRSRPAVGLVILAWALTSLAFFLGYAVSDWSTMLVPVWTLVGLWVVVGLDRTVRAVGRPRHLAAAVVAVALPVTALLSGYAEADRSGVDPQTDVDAALAAVDNDAIIFTVDNGTRHLFSYRLLPGGVGVRRNVWASRGRGGAFRADRAVYRIRNYCAPEPGPWFWPSQERGIAPSVPRGLHTYIYGVDYASQVRDSGFRVRHVSGKLYRFECSSAEPIREPATAR
ncbi:MAG: protein O-mannosyl-transferase family [Friedmanniella sp.]